MPLEAIKPMELGLEQTFSSRQAKLDLVRVAVEKRKLAIECQLKEIKSEIKAIEKAQIELWREEHGPNLSFFEIWFRLDENGE